MKIDNEAKTKKLRAEIDALDDSLLELINQRAQRAADIAAVKKLKDCEATFYCSEREAQVLRRIRSANPGPLSDEEITRLFREIMSACLALQKLTCVGFLGPEGTFTHEAALRYFGHSVSARSFSSIDGVFSAAETGAIEYGVVPVENSTEGVVTHTLDRFIHSPLKIVGELRLRIHHNLLSDVEDPAQIKTVYSHQQSFLQCKQWLFENLSDYRQIDVSSTAEAVLQTKNTAEAAAIASATAAERYNLKILRRNIEDRADNTTRFLVVGNHPVPPSGRDKTSILVSVGDYPGALAGLLSPLAQRHINMTRIESRPARTMNWEYVFFIDTEGHCEDEALCAALKELQQAAAFFKLLGSYPNSVL